MRNQPTDKDEIFNAAAELTDDAQRAGYLDDACAGDAELRKEVEDLLKWDRRAGDFLETPAPSVALASEIAEQPGSQIGHYKLLELIGEGGFGNVYMAQQQKPVRRTVALKIIKLGMDTQQVIARFEAERQALALMDHPHIARVLDAGATETGRPYFVMDLVKGTPITEYCDAHNLATDARLRLIIDACAAVQHAHQKGIIHRDIKPNNVLVTHQDGEPIPKIIDFGVAKAIDQRLTEKTLFTSYRQLIGTPEYMSPEQATFDEADVDTRSDVYSLGVLMYELFIGATPFDGAALRKRGYDEICRVIRESEPPTPSKRLSTLGDAVTEISQHRDAQPQALRKLLRGDLDWIVMKCLEKDRRRRYETVQGLARDIERHLSDEPVRARPPSTAYRLRKFVRKHRLGVAAAATVFVALALGLVRAEQQRRIAIAERDQAAKNLRMGRELVFEVIVPAARRMAELPFAQPSQLEVLQQARDFYEEILKQAGDDPAPRREMAGIHQSLGQLAWRTGRDAEPALQRSVLMLEDLAREFPSNPDHRLGLAKSIGWLSIWRQADLKLAEAVEQRRISLGIVQDLAAEYPSNAVYCEALVLERGAMGRRLVGVGKYDEAEPLSHAAVVEGGSTTPIGKVWRLDRYAYLLMRLARYDEAETIIHEALKIAQQELSPRTSPHDAGWAANIIWLARCHRMLGLLQLYAGRFDDAAENLRQSIDPVAPWLDEFPQAVWEAYSVAWGRHDLAEVLTAQGRLEEAERQRRLSLAAWESAAAAVPASVPHGRGLAHYRLGELLYQTGRTEEAQREFEDAQAIMEDLARRRPEEQVCHWQLICLLANCPDQAFRDPPRAVALAKHVLPPSAGHYWRYLALAQYRSGQWQDAAESIQQARDLRQGGDAYDRHLLAMALWQLGQKDEALKTYARAQQAIEAREPLFYEYVGAMAVERLQREAETLLGGPAGSGNVEGL